MSELKLHFNKAIVSISIVNKNWKNKKSNVGVTVIGIYITVSLMSGSLIENSVPLFGSLRWRLREIKRSVGYFSFSDSSEKLTKNSRSPPRFIYLKMTVNVYFMQRFHNFMKNTSLRILGKLFHSRYSIEYLQRYIEDIIKLLRWSFFANIVNDHNPWTKFAKKYPS